MLTWMVNRVPSITRPGFATEWHGDTTLDDTHSQSLCCTYHRQPAKHAPVVAPHDVIQFREVVCRQHRLSQIVREWALLRGETLGDRERTWEQRVVPRHTHLAGYLDETRAGASLPASTNSCTCVMLDVPSAFAAQIRPRKTVR